MAAWNLKREMRTVDWVWVALPVVAVVALIYGLDAKGARSRNRVEKLCANTLFGATPDSFAANARTAGFEVRSEGGVMVAYLTDYSPFPMEDRCEAKHNGKRITGLSVVTRRY